MEWTRERLLRGSPLDGRPQFAEVDVSDAMRDVTRDARVLALLKRIEWQYIPHARMHYCPECHATKEAGHQNVGSADLQCCELAALIRELS